MTLSNTTSLAVGESSIGLIAAQGDFPLLIARGARGSGVRVIAFAINGFASKEIEECADQTHWLELGQLGKLIELLHANGIRSISMAGRVPHTSVLQYRHFDMRAMKMLAKTLNKKPDSLLGAITRELETENIRVLDSTLFLKSLMPEPGLLTLTRALRPVEQEDVDFGYPIAKVIAGQDIGQTIIVKEKMVIAVEGVEGTDECIVRAGQLAGPGCVVVKVSKPAQDARFDVPVVGITTIRKMQQAGCTALAVSARETLIFNRPEVLAAAEQANIGIVAVSA